jgi:hypothetical protein
MHHILSSPFFLWGPDFVPCLVWEPVILPDFNVFSIAYIPNTTLLKNSTSLLNATPSVTHGLVWFCIEKVTLWKVLCL